MADLKSVRAKLLDSVDRWAQEIQNAPARSTMRHGILQKCYGLLDRMVEICTAEAVRLTGDAGGEACKSCSGGKPLSRMTLGQRAQVLEKLDGQLITVLAGKIPTRRGRVLGKSGIQLLHSISLNRNRLAHPNDISEPDVDQISKALACATEFCNLDLVTLIIGVQEAERREPKPVG
jgi:hypothetical protein